MCAEAAPTNYRRLTTCLSHQLLPVPPDTVCPTACPLQVSSHCQSAADEDILVEGELSRMATWGYGRHHRGWGWR